MEIRHLKLVKAIVEEGSITKAIDKLHLTQSALSYQLKEAEYQLGTKIFSRANKRLTLTKAGEEIYKTAIDILDKLQQTEKHIKKLVFGEVGEVKLITECHTAYHWMPPIMKQFNLLYPNIELKIMMMGFKIHPLDNLSNGSLDIVITNDPVKDEKIKYLELFQDEMVAVVSESHYLASKKYLSANDFSNEHLIIHSFPIETAIIYQVVLAPSSISPKKISAVPLTEATIEMVKANMGIAVMAKWAVQPYLSQGQVKAVKIGKYGLKRKQYIAILKNRSYPDYFNHLIELLQTEIYIV